MSDQDEILQADAKSHADDHTKSKQEI